MRAWREIAVGVARLQTLEDGTPRHAPAVTLHFAGTEREYVRIECVVRQREIEPMSLVIRDWQHVDRVTMALETIRVE